MDGAVRPARAEDIPQMEALITAERLPAYGLEEYLETFSVLEEGERLVGCAGLELYGEAALLRSVVVAAERRGGDAGRRLVEATLAQAEKRGVRRVYLFTMHASAFFSRMGFSEIAPDGFEEGVRASRQYQAVATIPALREWVKGMRLELGA